MFAFFLFRPSGCFFLFWSDQNTNLLFIGIESTARKSQCFVCTKQYLATLNVVWVFRASGYGGKQNRYFVYMVFERFVNKISWVWWMFNNLLWAFLAYRGAGVCKICILQTWFFGVLSAKKIAAGWSPIAPGTVKMACKNNFWCLIFSELRNMRRGAPRGMFSFSFLFFLFLFFLLFWLFLCGWFSTFFDSFPLKILFLLYKHNLLCVIGGTDNLL